MNERSLQKAVMGMKLSDEAKNRILTNCERGGAGSKRPRRRVRAVLAAACVCLLLGVIVLGAWMLRGGDRPEERPESASEVEAAGSDPAGEQTVSDGNLRKPELQYQIGMAEIGPPYESMEELLADSDAVVVGKVKGVSYQMRNFPLFEDTDVLFRELYTIFEIETLAAYQGDTGETFEVRMWGGQMGIREEEQLAAMGEDAYRGIPIVICGEEVPDLKIGQPYLFMLSQNSRGEWRFVGTDNKQGWMTLRNPLQANYYTGASAKDIICSFGEEKWTELLEAGIVSQ